MTTTPSQKIHNGIAKLKYTLKKKQEMKARAELAIEEIEAKLKSAYESLENHCGKLIVSEHAQLRYLERHLGIAFSDLQDSVVPESFQEHILKHGDGEYVVPCETSLDGYHKLRVQGNTVVTIV